MPFSRWIVAVVRFACTPFRLHTALRQDFQRHISHLIIYHLFVLRGNGGGVQQYQSKVGCCLYVVGRFMVMGAT
jgi:hypothetical protein